jgi:hypothetical protein
MLPFSDDSSLRQMCGCANGTELTGVCGSTSFDQHVIGGYKFLMRFYSPGDDIYMFGFSRGAYTARFLAEMLDHVGLYLLEIAAMNFLLTRNRPCCAWQRGDGFVCLEDLF